MSLGSHIRKARQAKHYNQEYVAQQLGVSRQAVSKWETGASEPDTKNLIALSELLKVSVDTLLEGKPGSEPTRPKRLLWLAGALFALSLVFYGIGLVSGAYFRMVMIPIGTSLEVGLPFLYYGTSVSAVICMIGQWGCLAAAMLLVGISWAIRKR